MAQSVDPGHFFQTSESIAATEARTAKSKNTNGAPIKLGVKILSAIAHTSSSIILACADGLAREVDLVSRSVSRTFQGAQAPLTSLAISSALDGSDDTILFAGCWDKTIHSWSLTTGKPLRRLTGHTDFVKSLATTSINGRPLLISGSTDASIIIWDVASGNKLQQVKSHVRGVLSLSINGTTLYSGDSVRDIRIWNLSGDGIKEATEKPVVVHETSVNAVRAVADDEGEVELWSASSDKSVKRSVQRGGKWEVDTTLQHPDFVKDVLVVDPQGRFVATACRDGDVRIWESGTGKLVCIFEGHFDEVSALVGVDGGKGLVSVSLDGTVRSWKVEEVAMREVMLKREKPVIEVEEEKKEGKVAVMTAEEEAELAELMDSD